MHHTDPFQLSQNGSTRATAYKFSNKSVTIDGKTHVVWLDAVAQVCARTFDHATGRWGDTVTPYEGADNHTTPAITVDAEKRLHLLYGPHGWWGDWNQARFNHAVAQTPNSVEDFEETGSFGYNATYASIVHMPCGLDAAAYRGGPHPPSAIFERQRRLGGWTTARPLMCQDIPPQYTHVGAHIACDVENTLYFGAHFYAGERGHSIGAAVLKSTDLGDTWTDLTGRTVRTPVTYSPEIAVPHPPRGRLDGLALGPDGTLWVGSCTAKADDNALLISRWTEQGWQTTDASTFLPEGWTPIWATLCVDTANRVHAALTAGRFEGDGGMKAWGHPSLEVFHLWSEDETRSFQCAMVSRPDDDRSNWFAAISQPGPFHPVENPVILYTRGIAGEGCSPETTTEVYCVMTS